MENENLAEMVKNQDETVPTRFSEADLDIPTKEETENIDEEEVDQEEAFDVKTIALNEWFEENHEKFGNINHVKASIRGVDPSKTLIMSVLTNPTDPNPGENADRKIHVFENADDTPVLDLPGLSMDVFNNGFKIVCNPITATFLKCYGVKTGLFVVFCNDINNQLIPYAVNKLKKTDEGINLVGKNPVETTLKKLNENADLEALEIMYKQIGKGNEQLITNQDVVDWFLKRQTEVTDVNHHLQIDNIIINILQ